MQNLENILIPLIAIISVFSIPIIAIIYYYKQKGREMDERALMIEKGITPPPLEREKNRRKRSKKMEDGLNLLAIGMGLLVGYSLQHALEMNRLFAIGGSILFFLGVANVLMVVFESKEINSDEK